MAGSEARRVLIVEDDAWVRRFMHELLSDEGYDVVEAADGGTGLRLADQWAPELIILDVAMPDFTGMDVLHGLKRMARTRHIPVVIHTAWAAVLSPQDIASVAAVLDKPTDVPTLLDEVRNALASSTRPRTRGQTSRSVTYS